MRTASLTIDTQPLKDNLKLAIDKVPVTTKVLAMVKADAYGHGLQLCVPALTEADALGVAFFKEAQTIRSLGWTKDIVLIEGVFSEEEWQHSLQENYQSVVHHGSQVEWALNYLPQVDSPSRTIWLKVDTGMNRLGFEPIHIVNIARQLVASGYHLILTSHFANADSASHPNNAKQIVIFSNLLKKLRHEVDVNIKASLCNSAGIINFPDCHFDWVRPGIMLYGSSPLHGVSASSLKLKPVMKFEAKIMAIHEIAVGSSVGYGSQFIASRPTIKGIVSVGYGDGYPRSVNDSAWVAIHLGDQCFKCPLIGRVSMDMIAIDLTDVIEKATVTDKYDMALDSNTSKMKPFEKLEGIDRADSVTSSNSIISASSIGIGSLVTLWGNALEGEPAVDDVAAAAQTIGYELLCRVTQRPLRKVV